MREANPIPRGQRKLRHIREQSGMVLIAFIAAAYFKVDPALFGTFAGALAALSGAFIYGNVKEHQVTPLKTDENKVQ